MTDEKESLRRWRLILGGDEADGTQFQLSELDSQIDDALSALYDFERKRNFNYGQNGGGGGSGGNGAQALRLLVG
jgi:hypothetical protein